MPKPKPLEFTDVPHTLSLPERERPTRPMVTYDEFLELCESGIRTHTLIPHNGGYELGVSWKKLREQELI